MAACGILAGRNCDVHADLVWYIVAPGTTQVRLMGRMVPTATTTVLTSTDWNLRP